jgi:hypothetical protein
MKPAVYAGLVLLTLSTLVATAGQGSYEGVTKEMLATLEQINKVLATIKDQDSATAAKPDLKQAATKIVELRKQADEMKQPSKEEKDRLQKEYMPKFEAVFKKLKEESTRVNGIPGGDAALAELAVLKDKKKDGK